MSGWISVKERLPEAGTPIWALFLNKHGRPKADPVREGDYERSRYDETCIGFTFGARRNTIIEPEHCLSAGLSHWQPRRDGIPPPPGLGASAPVLMTPKRENGKRPYNLSPEGRAAKQEAMREYWRKKKGQAAIGGGA